MSLDSAATKPHERLAEVLSDDMASVNALIRERMASDAAPRIPEVTAHLVEAGGKRLRPMLTLASARLCGYDGPYHIHRIKPFLTPRKHGLIQSTAVLIELFQLVRCFFSFFISFCKQ